MVIYGLNSKYELRISVIFFVKYVNGLYLISNFEVVFHEYLTNVCSLISL